METEQTEQLFDYTKEKVAISSLISSWAEEKERVKDRRMVRKNKKNVVEEQQKGTILSDETIIPDRTINLNIKRTKSAYVNYTTQSQRILIITPVDNPDESVESLELWFTRGMRYPHWKIPWIRGIDAFCLHGGITMEVVYDPEKPLGCAIEYIPRENLIFPIKTRDLQATPRVLRHYELTIVQLEEFEEKYGFNPDVVKELKEKFTANRKEDFVSVYRVLMKKKGVVYNAWYCEESSLNWLRDPRPHEIGLFDFTPEEILPMLSYPALWDEPAGVDPITQEQLTVRDTMMRPMPLRMYPLFFIKLEETEDEQLLEAQGRASLDIHVQEALTHLLTNTVNATTRASHLYASAEEQPGEQAELRELGALKPGVVMSRKTNFFQPPWPNNIIIAVTQALDVRKAQEAGHADYAATARKDANKTATEMELAAGQAQEVRTMDVDVYASPWLDIHALCFMIARHQAIFGLCKPPPDPLTLLGDYNLSAAGDVEVVKREMDKQNAKEFFNIVKGTPLAEKMFIFLLERYFPDQASAWKAILSSPDKDAIIQQLVSVLQSLPTDELTPDQQSALANVIAVAQSVVGAPGNPTSTEQTGGGQEQSPAPSNEMQEA